ncbi:MAG: DUF6265 family protein [Micropepsaceae bacterium]
MVRVWLAAAVAVILLVGGAEVRAESVDAWGATAMLEGQWREVRGSAVTDEVWTNNKGNVIVGASRTVDGLSNAFEFMRIENRKEGIVFMAQPDGGKATSFRLTAHDAKTLVFSNPAHDFPQRIEYRRTGLDTLEATAGMIDGKGQKLEFKYTLVR